MNPVLRLSGLCLLALAFLSIVPCAAAPITGVFVDVAHIHHDALSNGDTWDFCWAPDDNIYSFACDGRGYNHSPGRNINFNVLTGNQWDQLVGAGVSTLSFGKSGQKWPNQCNWKASGGDCIDGTLYGFVGETWYGNQTAFGGPKRDPYLRQTVVNMSLIKSTDLGHTWTRDVQSNYDKPMWTSRKFSDAYFFKFGQNGGNTRQDDQHQFVYAISDDGYWNDGTALYLGRVPRTKLPDLNAADWQYWSGGKWSASVDDATPLDGFPNGQRECVSGSPIWLPKLQRYVTVIWYDPGGMKRWYYPSNVTFAFYQAEHPWGPWRQCGEIACNDCLGHTAKPVHEWYGPSLSPKFLTANSDGSVTAILTFSGSEWQASLESLYKNNSCPVTFFTTPQLNVAQNFNDSEAKYSPEWKYAQNRGFGDYLDDAHITTTPDASCEFAFTGRGIEALGEKNSDMGDVEISLDGQSQGTISLYQDPMPRLYQIPFYRNMQLTAGPHTLRIINKSKRGQPCIIDGFRVYTSNDFDPHNRYQIINRATRGPLNEKQNRWVIVPRTDGTYEISDGLEGSAKSMGRFRIDLVGNASYRILDAETGKAISADGIAQPYRGRDDQKWEIVSPESHAASSQP